jgi:hypothetical protein
LTCCALAAPGKTSVWLLFDGNANCRPPTVSWRLPGELLANLTLPSAGTLTDDGDTLRLLSNPSTLTVPVKVMVGTGSAAEEVGTPATPTATEPATKRPSRAAARRTCRAAPTP